MASGDVQISVSQGVPPFVVATSAGQDLQIVDVAVSYSDNDNCVVAELEIDKDTAGNWKARRSPCRSAPPRITASSSQMDHFGVDISTMEIVDMAPPTARPPSRRAPRHGLRLGRRAAPHEGARQRAADRRREGPSSASSSST
jgi:ABC-type taurine transport system substrate-binding protein